MIGVWVIIIIVLIAGISLGVRFIKIGKEEAEKGMIIGGIISILVAVVIAFGLLFWLYNTESGARVIKDTQSDFNGGIERTVTVYDIDGDLIQKYSGKFDVDYDSERIKFDDENGKRHVIYYTTGTVIIDEK